MRHALLIIWLCSLLPGSLHAQCNTPALKKEIAEAEKQKDSVAYPTFLLHLDSVTAVNNDNCGRALVNEKLGVFYNERDAIKSIEYREAAAKFYTMAGDKVNAVYCRQEIAFAYNNQLGDYPATMQNAQQAISEWGWLRDTIQQANMYKYLGSVYGKLRKWDEYERCIKNAIELYRYKKSSYGLATAYFDYASMLFEQKKYLPASLMLVLSKNQWQVENNKGKIAGINNFLLRTYILLEDYNNATNAYNDNLAIIDSPDVDWKDKLNFHTYAIEYFQNTGEPKDADKHRAEYKALKERLIKKGIKVD